MKRNVCVGGARIAATCAGAFNFRLDRARARANETCQFERFAYAITIRVCFAYSRNCFIYVGHKRPLKKKLLPLDVRTSPLVAAVADTLSHEKSVAPTNIFSRCLHCCTRTFGRSRVGRSFRFGLHGPVERNVGPSPPRRSARHRR